MIPHFSRLSGVRWYRPLLGGIELSDVLIRLLILGEIVKTERCKNGLWGEISTEGEERGTKGELGKRPWIENH